MGNLIRWLRLMPAQTLQILAVCALWIWLGTLAAMAGTP